MIFFFTSLKCFDQCTFCTSFLFLSVSFLRSSTKYRFYLCPYQRWTGGHRLPFLVPGTTASLRNLRPLCTIVLSCRNCSLPAFTGFPVSGYHVLCLFSLLFVCIHPIGFSLTSPEQRAKREDGTISAAGERPHSAVSTHLHLCRGISTLAVPHPAAWPAFFGRVFEFPSLYQLDGTPSPLPPTHSPTHPTKARRTSVNSKLSSRFNGHCL